jgi:hypothetical protein
VSDLLIDLDEIRRVAADLHGLGLRRSPARLLAAIELAPDERIAPVQHGEGVTPMGGIPWGLHEMLWRIYADHGHGAQSAKRLAERGGFSRAEIGMLAVGDYGTASYKQLPEGRTIPLLDLYRDRRPL